MTLRKLLILSFLTLALAASAASILGDPRIYSGAECCTCLSTTSPGGATVGGDAASENCLPGDTAEAETCSNEVATHMVEEQTTEPVRVLDMACVDSHCQDVCDTAREQGITFTVSDG